MKYFCGLSVYLFLHVRNMYYYKRVLHIVVLLSVGYCTLVVLLSVGYCTLSIAFGASLWKQNLMNITSSGKELNSVSDHYKKNFITSGWYATRSQFPYMVAIQRVEETSGIIFPCGGSLISQYYILTAAHCITGQYISKLYVKLGAYDLSKLSEYGRYETEIPMGSLKVHSNYNSETYVNDIGLILLPEAIMFSSYIQPLSLPFVSAYLENNYYEILDGIVSGWGTFSAEIAQISPILKYTFTDVVDSSTCSSYYSVYFNYILNYAQLCAISFSDGGHPCPGDSGGPLIDKYSYPPVQIGIVSLGGKTCNRFIPTIYTKITEYLDWIKDNTDV